MTQRRSPAAGVPSGIRAGGNPSGRPTKRAASVFRDIAHEQPTELERKAIAEALGFTSVDEVPDYFESFIECVWWMRKQQAVRGHDEAIRDFLDRANPKPRRMEVSGPGGGPLRGAITVARPSDAEAAASRQYYEELAGGTEGEEDA
jgi:hypothetical protein